MKKEARILHITDFHLRDPGGTEEHLRKDNYEEYLKRPLALLREHAGGPISCIIATGDFVDRGKADNFAHAAIILNHIAVGCGLNASNIAVCPGNHDFDYDLEVAGDPDAARAAYRTFSRQFGNKDPVKESKRTTLCKLNDNLWALMIDSTIGGASIGGPGNLADEEVDDLMTNFLSIVPDDDLLVVGTHFPVQTFPDTFLDYEEPGWTSKHVWSLAYPLKTRIALKRESSTTAWLCGDSHAPDECRLGSIYYVMTGRLGIAPGPDDSRIVRQAKLLCLPATETPARVLTLSFELPGHEPQAHYGVWLAELREIRTVTQATLPSPLLVGTLSPPEDLRTPKVKPQRNLELLSEEVQNQIVSTIRRQSLYTLGRFTTSSEQHVSLSWVSIGPLLNEPGLLPGIVDKMVRWIRARFGIGDMESAAPNYVLIGIDCWGAVLASQISVLTGAENFCIGARSHGEHYTAAERIGTRLLAAVRNAKAMIFVTDVVVTGLSLKQLYDDIVEKIHDFNPINLEWLCLSVMADGSRPLIHECTFIRTHCSACITIPRPVLPTSAFPDESLLPSTLALTESSKPTR